MEEISLTYDDNCPQYSCSECSKCNSVFGISLSSIKNRGCCWYFPKFNLYEIHKMVKSSEGQVLLNKIINMPKTKIYNYYIHVIGEFDKAKYQSFINSSESKKKPYALHDETMFFRTCSFVKPGEGCMIPPKYRSYICNFFICDEIINDAKRDNKLDSYLEERDRYIHWIDWENNSIQALLEEQHIDLVHNRSEVLEVLKNMPLENFEFEHLKAIYV